MKVEMRNAKLNGEERLKAREELQEKLVKLKQATPIQGIEDAISNHVTDLRQKLTSYFQSDDIRHRFCTWSEKDLPHIDDLDKANVKKIKQTYKSCIEERFQCFLQDWENRENLFMNAHADLEARFQQGFFDFEQDIRDIDLEFVGESEQALLPSGIRPGLQCSPLAFDPRMKKFLVVTLGIFLPVLIPVGLAAGVISAPVFGYLAFGKHIEERLLRNNPRQALTELSKEFLEAFIKHDVCNHVHDEFLEEMDRIASIKKCQKQLFSKYEQKCKDLTRSEDEERDKETLKKYDPFHVKLKEMNQELMFDAIENGIEVMSCQIDVKRVRYKESDILGEGSYGTVFKGKFTRPGQRRKAVAVKKLREVPEPSNVATFLREADMLK